MKKKRFKDLRPYDYPLFFILSPIIVKLSSTAALTKDKNGNVSFLEHCTAIDKIFAIAKDVGAPIEWRHSHYYVFFKGTWRIITRKCFQEFIEKCEKVLGIE